MSLRDIASPKKKPRQRYTRQLTAKQVRAMKKRGYDAERELVHMFRDEGYDAIRVPVSAPSREPLPDVFAIKDDKRDMHIIKRIRFRSCSNSWRFIKSIPVGMQFWLVSLSIKDGGLI